MAAPGTGTGSDELTHRQRNVLLVVVALALMMVVSAVSGLNVALPDLAVDTGASQTQVTWIVDAYTVVFVGLLLPAGAFGDRFGRRGILVAGLAVFGAAAAAAMTVESPQSLIVLRAVMGAGAAAVMPTTLSIITTSFPPSERARAVGVWVGVAGGGAVIGLFGSGVLLEYFSWNSFFGLNVTLAVLALAGTLRFVPGSRDPDAPRLDPIGGVAGLLAVVGLVFGIIEGPERGWTDPLTVTAFVVAVLALPAFIAWELRTDEPMLDVRLFSGAGLSAGALTITAQFFGSFGLLYIVLQYLQYVVGRSPLMAAVALTPLPVVLIPLARLAPRLVGRVGLNRVMGLGLALSGSGLLVVATISVDFVYWHLAVGLVVFAAGMGLAGTPGTTAITSSLPAAKQGVGSAVNDTSRELGSALGIAILGSVLNSVYRTSISESTTGLPPEIAARAESSIAFLQQGTDRLAPLGPAGTRLITDAQSGFVDAARTSLVVAGVTLLVTSLIVFWRAPRREVPDTAGPGSPTRTGSTSTSVPGVDDAVVGGTAVPLTSSPAPRVRQMDPHPRPAPAVLETAGGEPEE